MRFRFSSVIFAVMLLFSCNNGSHCYESSDTLMVTVFSASTAVNINSILVTGYQRDAVGDTLEYSNVPALTSKVGLPLSLSSDSTGFNVYANGKSGTFWLKHTMDIKLISQPCGFAPYYKLTATRHSSLIDSIKISDPNVDPKSVETYETYGQNITIYLHLSTP